MYCCTHYRGPFHKSSYERLLLYEFVEPVLNFWSNEFVALTNLCETGPIAHHTHTCRIYDVHGSNSWLLTVALSV